MSEIASLQKKISDAQKTLRSNKDLTADQKATIQQLLDYLVKNFKDLPAKRDRLEDCIKELKTLSQDVDAYNKAQNSMQKYAYILKNQCSRIENPKAAKFLAELGKNAAAADAIKPLEVP